VELYTSWFYTPAWRVAEEVAGFLNWPLVDFTGKMPEQRGPKEFEESRAESHCPGED
jgi:hypothetical protein